MHMPFTILKKGLTLIAVPLLVQVVFIAVLARAHADHDRAQEQAVHTKEVIIKVEELHRSLLEGYAGARGLVFSAPAEAGRHESALRRVPAQIRALQGLVADNPRQAPRIAELAGRSDAFLRWGDDVDRLVRSNARDRAMAELGRGAGLLDGLRATIDEIRAEEEALDRQRMEHLRASSARQVWTLIGGGAAIVVSTLILALLFLQGIIQRLAVLRDNARRFGEGKPLNPQLAGRDEITEVDRAFHDMADTLGQQKQENEMFVYSVSHDLRSPLVNLQGFSEELSLSCRDLRELFRRDDVPEPVRRRGLQLMDRDIEESIRFIQAAVGRLARIIDALLRLSRAGRVEYQWQEIDLATTVGKIVDALHDSIAAKKAQIAVGELPPAWGDPTALEQVFANLIGNAVQYLDPDRPGRIEIDGGEPDGTDLPPGLRVYRVRDNGLGIPEAYHHRMFTAFSRLHAGVAQGEGIGLALVRRMVERHGGRIWLESSPGAGTTFFVALPAASGDGAAPGAGGHGPPPQAAAAAPPPAHPEPQPRGDRQPWAPSPS
jgi:signal transduction histidine kinase